MKRRAALVVITICSFACCEVSSVAQEQFKKLSGTEIRAKFTGMEFTDEMHWGEVYGANVKLTSEEMGKKRAGTWRIEKNQLCTDYGKDTGTSCYEVWVHPLRILNEASAGPEDARQKSRWTQALKYAVGWHQPAERLKWSFQTNGVIAGTARKSAILNAQRKARRMMTIGGPVAGK
jgi:hypothetical protein